MPASESGLEVVHPETNQRSSVVTALRKTRFVVRRGRTGIRSAEDDEGSGFERLKRSCGGANNDRVPVPVRSGRCSPRFKMSRIKSRYWCSSCEEVSIEVVVGTSVAAEDSLVDPFCRFLTFSFRRPREWPGAEAGSGSTAEGAIVSLDIRYELLTSLLGLESDG